MLRRIPAYVFASVSMLSFTGALWVTWLLTRRRSSPA